MSGGVNETAGSSKPKKATSTSRIVMMLTGDFSSGRGVSGAYGRKVNFVLKRLHFSKKLDFLSQSFKEASVSRWRIM